LAKDKSRDRALVAAFASYLRRQLAGTYRVAVVRRRSIRVPRRAGIVIASGPPNRLVRHAIARRHDLHLQFEGTANADAAPRPALPVAIFDPWDLDQVGGPPSSFTVTAIVTTYNEVEIIDQLIDRLVDGGVRVHVIDNWSTDGTFERVRDRTAHDDVGVERWPSSGPTPYFDLAGLLGRVEQVAHSSGADWVLHHDADEIHESPWPGLSLRDALWGIDRWGFNAIDHVGLDFRPIDNRWHPGDDLASSFEGFELPEFSSYFTLVKGWKPQPASVDLAGSGGHEAVFADRKVFPYKFVIRHYPIRSQGHGEKKILSERKQRFDPGERAKGWHTHYDTFVEGSSFLWDPSGLHKWVDLDERLLIQRLSGAGLPGNPRPKESLS
jgi:glycosyltransferase involved in cell wall biosynthesis